MDEDGEDEQFHTVVAAGPPESRLTSQACQSTLGKRATAPSLTERDRFGELSVNTQNQISSHLVKDTKIGSFVRKMLHHSKAEGEASDGSCQISGERCQSLWRDCGHKSRLGSGSILNKVNPKGFAKTFPILSRSEDEDGHSVFTLHPHYTQFRYHLADADNEEGDCPAAAAVGGAAAASSRKKRKTAF